MKPIKQQHETGCGIAAIAMIAGVSYQKALEITHPNYLRRKQQFINWKQLRNSLDKFGIKYDKLHRFRGKLKEIVAHAKLSKSQFIVGSAEKTRQKNWHYLVIDKDGKVYDPFYGREVLPEAYPVVRSFLRII